jgi:tetratricopeptide (TPR) repeat protein
MVAGALRGAPVARWEYQAKLMSRLTRRELREDPILTALTDASDWFQAHAREVLIGVGAVVVVVVAVVLWQSQGRHNEEAASELLLRANYQMNIGDVNGAMASYKEIQGRYAGTPSARRALRDEGDAQFIMGRFADAQKLYQKYLDKVGEKGIEGRGGLSGVAACLEQQRKFEPAAEAYAKLGGMKDGGEMNTLALWAEARCWVAANKLDKAEAAYQRIIDEHRLSRYVPMARMSLAEVKARAGH